MNKWLVWITLANISNKRLINFESSELPALGRYIINNSYNLISYQFISITDSLYILKPNDDVVFCNLCKCILIPIEYLNILKFCFC